MKKSKPKPASEKQIEESILTWLNMQSGCFAFKLNVKGTWNKRLEVFMRSSKWIPRGAADIIFCYKGKFGCFEVKKDKQTVHKFWNQPGLHELEQQSFIDKIRSIGGVADVVSSLEEAQDLLRSPSVNQQ
jgi:hypothetical protein